MWIHSTDEAASFTALSEPWALLHWVPCPSSSDSTFCSSGEICQPCAWFGPKDDQLACRGSLLFSGCLLLQPAQQGVRVRWLRGNMRLRCIPEYPEYLNEFVQVLISQLKPQDTTALGYRSSHSPLGQALFGFTANPWVSCVLFGWAERFRLTLHQASVMSPATSLVTGSNYSGHLHRRHQPATSGDQWRPVATVVCQRVDIMDIHYHHKPQRPNIFISFSSHLHLKGHQPSKGLEHRSNWQWQHLDPFGAVGWVFAR